MRIGPLLFALLLLAAPAAQAQSFGITPLGVPDGYDAAYAADINAQGAVCGNLQRSGQETPAFVWTAIDGFTLIENPWAPLAGTEAVGISDSGRVAGDAFTTEHEDEDFFGARLQGFTWTEDPIVNIGSLDTGEPNRPHDSQVRDVSAGGSLVGLSNGAHYTWTDGSFADLQDVIGTDATYTAEAIAGGGIIAGNRLAPGDLASTAYVFAGSLTVIDHPDINGESVYGLSGDGAWATGYGFPFRSFVWDASSGDVIDIGAGQALDINSSGVAVGVDVGNQPQAMITWDGVWQPLLPLLAEGHGWERLNRANAINDAGQVAGWGTINGQPTAFVIDTAGSAELELTLAAGTPRTGEVSWDITVTNLADDPALNLQLVAPGPAGTTYVDDGFQGALLPAGCVGNPDAYQLDCSWGDLDPGESRTGSLRLAVDAPGLYTLEVTATADTPAGGTGSVSAELGVEWQLLADLVFEATSELPPQSQDWVDLSCELRNDGALDAEDVTVGIANSDADDPSTQDVTDAAVTRSDGVAVVCGPVPGAQRRVSCSVGTLPPGGVALVSWSTLRPQSGEGATSDTSDSAAFASTDTSEESTTNNVCSYTLERQALSCSAAGGGTTPWWSLLLLAGLLRRRATGPTSPGTASS